MNIIQNRDTNEPPDELDGAAVILWAFNPQKPFFIMTTSDGTPYKSIHGFAICQYKGKKGYYKFSCDIGWNVENDKDCDSIDEAINSANDISLESINWNQKVISN